MRGVLDEGLGMGCEGVEASTVAGLAGDCICTGFGLVRLSVTEGLFAGFFI